MVSSAEIYVLGKIAELAKRYQLSASDADAILDYIDDDNNGFFKLSFQSNPTDGEKQVQLDKMLNALGCKRHVLTANNIFDMEEIVENALSLAPRSRKI